MRVYQAYYSRLYCLLSPLLCTMLIAVLPINSCVVVIFLRSISSVTNVILLHILYTIHLCLFVCVVSPCLSVVLPEMNSLYYITKIYTVLEKEKSLLIVCAVFCNNNNSDFNAKQIPDDKSYKSSHNG